jgi:predicted Na+-dependent transporter
MKNEDRENIFFILFIIIVIVMAVIYFNVPERAAFFENQIKWWREFRG